MAHRYHEDWGVSFAPEQVTITVGGKQALALLYTAILDRGSEVLVPSPHWPTFAEAARIVGGKPVLLPLSERGGFRLTVRAVRKAIGPRTRAILVNSPSNPTGAVVDPDELLAIARLARRHGVFLIFDDTYSHLIFREGAPPRWTRWPPLPGFPGGGGDHVEGLLHDWLAHRLGHRARATGGGLRCAQLSRRPEHRHLLAGGGGPGPHRTPGLGS